MDPILKILLGAIAVFTSLQLIGAITAAARRRARRLPSPEGPESATAAEPAPALDAVDERPFPYRPLETGDEHKAGYWWRQLLSGRAVLGLLFLPLQPVILLINSYLLAIRFEGIIGQPGDPLFMITTFGWEREISLFDVLGCLISLIQVISAAVMAQRLSKDQKSSWPFAAAVAAWLLITVFEIAVTALSVVSQGGSIWLAVFNSLLAAGLALADSLLGIHIIEYLIVPLTLAVAWSIAAPFRILWKIIALKASFYSIGPPRKPRSNKPNPIYSAVGAVDTVFEPLRALDRRAYQVFRRQVLGRMPVIGSKHPSQPITVQHQSPNPIGD